MEVLRFNEREELRDWLSAHAKDSKECWVAITRSTKEKKENELFYLDVVEEALCFGWIDSTLKRIDEQTLAQRLSKRGANSHWTELNKARLRRLIRQNKVTAEGRSVISDEELYHFELHPAIKQAIANNEALQESLKSLPPLYVKIRLDNIQSYPKQKEQCQKRWNKFVQTSLQQKTYGAWNDGGRLRDDE